MWKKLNFSWLEVLFFAALIGTALPVLSGLASCAAMQTYKDVNWK